MRKITYTALLATLLIAVAAGTASAGTYSVYACAGPNDEPLANGSWVTDPASDSLTEVSEDCATLGVRGIRNSGGHIPAFAYGALTFDAPDDTTIEQFRVAGSTLVDDPGGENYRAGLSVSGTSGLFFGCTGTHDCSQTFGNPYDLVTPKGGSEQLVIELTCLTAGGCNVWNGAGGETAEVLASKSEVVLRDDVAPSVQASGSLLSGGTQGEILELDFTATDEGGGVASVALRIDGKTVETQVPGGSCEPPYTDKQPCPASFDGEFFVDSSGIAVGPHTVEVVVTDAAGNAGSSGASAFAISSPPSPPAPPAATPGNGTPAVLDPVVSFDKKLTKIKRGSTTIRGRVLTRSGVPVVGARITLQTLDVGDFGSEPVDAGTAVTGADGSFSVRVRAAGAKRVTAFFSPYAGAPSTAMFSTLVRQELSLTAKPSRRKVKPFGSVSISGRLSGAGDAAKDAPVEIQTVIRGKWRPIGVEEADARGNYKWTYEFINVRRNADFRFRAVVRRNASWPWPSEFTSPLTVSVRR